MLVHHFIHCDFWSGNKNDLDFWFSIYDEVASIEELFLKRDSLTKEEIEIIQYIYPLTPII